ncbi:MAG TPA: hypothetical protein ENK86_06370, partial [Campylobacterales bacterium]|nr:hypothetical protein [Campylobacterales bacterium]
GRRFTTLKTTHRKKYSTNVLKKYKILPSEPFNESKAYLLKTHNKTHDDIWMGGQNFRVLTRYNNSTNYGMAIHLIAEAVSRDSNQSAVE